MHAELTRVVYTIQQFDRASTDHSANVNEKTRWKRRQGKEGELLQEKNKQFSYLQTGEETVA